MKISVIFPPEILDHIFSFLDNDPSTWSTLKACSETIRDPVLHGVVDRRLYAHIVVTNFRSNGPRLLYYSDLFQYLSSNPQVTNYIRTLQIQIEIPGPHRWYNQVSSILRMLPTSALKGITLSSRPIPTTEPVAWFHLHETFRNAFLDCLSSPNLLNASIQLIDGVPLSILNRCTKLQTLSLRQINCTLHTFDVQFPLQLASLIIDRSSYLPTIISWAKMSRNLRTLSFRSDDEKDYPLLTSLFHSYSDTLIELELDFGTFYWTYHNIYCGRTRDPRNSPPTLSPLPNLQQLTVSAEIHCRKSLGVSDVFSPIPTIARFVATSPSLKRLILRVGIAPWHIDLTAKSDIWRPLASLAKHPSLECIKLGVISLISNRRDMGDIDIISALMGVPALEQMCKGSFLSMETSYRVD